MASWFDFILTGGILGVAEGMIVEWVEDEAVVLNSRTGELHYLNPPAALVYAYLLEFGYTEGLAQLTARFGHAVEPIEQIEMLIVDFEQKGLFAIEDSDVD